MRRNCDGAKGQRRVLSASEKAEGERRKNVEDDERRRFRNGFLSAKVVHAEQESKVAEHADTRLEEGGGSDSEEEVAFFFLSFSSQHNNYFLLFAFYAKPFPSLILDCFAYSP